MTRFLTSRRRPGLYDEEYIPITAERAPTANDFAEIGSCWIDKLNDDVYFLTSIVANSATWINAGGGTGTFNALTVTTTATIGTTLTLSSLTAGTMRTSATGIVSTLADGNDGTLLIGATAGTPAWATLTAGAGIAIGNAANAITITATGATASSFAGDGGVAVPDGTGQTTLAGGTNITTVAGVNTVTFNLDNDVTLTGSLTAGVDLTMTTGDCTITGTTDGAQTIYLRANGGTSETIDIHSDQGTDPASVYVHSDVGGLSLVSGLASVDAINVTATNGGVDIDGALQVNITSSENAAGAITVLASAGGISMTANGAALEPFELSSTSVLSLTSSYDAVNAILIETDAGTAESIYIHADQGTAVDSINIESDVGGVTLTSGLANNNAINFEATAGGIDMDAVTQINIASAQAAATAIVINASDAAGGIDVDYGTGGMTVDGANGAFTLQTGTGDISIGTDVTDHDIAIGDNSGTNALTIVSGTGNTGMTSTGTTTIDCAGVLELNSSAGVISIANDDIDQAVNISTDGERTTTIGSNNGAAGVVIDCGTTGVSVGATATAHTSTFGSTNTISDTTIQAGTGAMTFTAGGAYDVNAAGAVTIDSSASTISIAADDIDQAVNISTDGERTTTIGSNNGAAGVVIDCGTTGVSVGATATAHTSTFGSTNTTSDTTIQAGTGAMTFTAGGAYDVNAAGAVTIDSDASTISIAADDIDQAVNISTDGERTTTIGSNNGAAGVVIDCGTAGVSVGATATAHTSTFGSTNTISDTTIQSGTGAMTFTAGGDCDVNAVGNVTIDSSTGNLSMGADAVAQNVDIGTGAAVKAVTVGSTNTTSSTLIQSGTGDITLSSTDDIVLTSAGLTTVNTDITLLTATTGVVFQEGPKVIAGAGSPNGSITAPKGSLYLRTDGSGTTDRAFINTDSGTTWTALTTAA